MGDYKPIANLHNLLGQSEIQIQIGCAIYLEFNLLFKINNHKKRSHHE